MQILLIVGGLMIGLLVLATAVKFYEVHKATNWRSVPGKVLASKSVARRVRTAESHARAEQGGDLTLRTFAEVRYEYRVDGKRYTSDRVSIGENLGDYQVAETLARYPVGARVAVFYDPADPGKAVLQKDAPPGVFRTLGIFIAILVALFAMDLNSTHWRAGHAPRDSGAGSAALDTKLTPSPLRIAYVCHIYRLMIGP